MTTEVPELERLSASLLYETPTELTFVAIPFWWLLWALGLLLRWPKRAFLHFHLAQLTLLFLSFSLVSVGTCGLGIFVFALPAHRALKLAGEAARRGEWHVTPGLGTLWPPPRPGRR